MTTKSQIDGDTAQVTLNASGTTGSGKWSIKGSCYSPPPSESLNGPATTTSPPAAGAPSAETFTSESDLCVGVNAYLLRPLAPSDGVGQETAISVVQHDGRWFVSPVGTVLDSIDQTIATLDRRTLYALLNIPGELPPDGAVTLAKPISVPASMRGPRVYTLAGEKGEQLLGLITPNEATYDSSLVSAQVYSPDGSLLYQADGMFSGQPFTVPADGNYKLVVTRFYFSAAKDATVTVWDAADAPAAAKDNHGEQCTYTENGSSCSSSGETSGALGVPTFPPPTVPPVGSPGETCTSTANSQSCTSETVFVPPDQNPGTTVEIGNGLSVTGNGAGTSVPVTVPVATSTTAGG